MAVWGVQGTVLFEKILFALNSVNSIVNGVFAPFGAMALAGIAYAAVRALQSSRSSEKRQVFFLIAGLLFAALWRIVFRASSIRYCLAATVPVTMLAVWWGYDWCFGEGRRRFPKVLRLAIIVGVWCAILWGCTEKNFRNRRREYSEWKHCGEMIHRYLLSAEHAAVVALNHHGIRLFYYAEPSKLQGRTEFYEVMDAGSADLFFKKLLYRYDMAAIIIERRCAEKYQQVLKKLSCGRVKTAMVETPLRRGGGCILFVENRKAPSFGFLSQSSLPELPPDAELVFHEDFENPRIVTGKSPVLADYAKRKFAFVASGQIAMPEKMELAYEWRIDHANRITADFGVKQNKADAGNRFLFSNISTWQEVRCRKIPRRHKRYIAEFLVRGTPGAEIEFAMLRYRGKQYLGEQRNIGWFYALHDNWRFCRIVLNDPAVETDELVFSLHLHGLLEIDDLKIFGTYWADSL